MLILLTLLCLTQEALLASLPFSSIEHDINSSQLYGGISREPTHGVIEDIGGMNLDESEFQMLSDTHSGDEVGQYSQSYMDASITDTHSRSSHSQCSQDETKARHRERLREIRERRKAFGLRPGERLPRLPEVPGFELLKGSARTKQRSIWLGLGDAGTSAKDLQKVHNLILFEALQKRLSNRELTVRDSVIRAAKMLEAKYRLRPGVYSDHILPDWTIKPDGEKVRNPVGKRRSFGVRGKRIVTPTSDEEDEDYPIAISTDVAEGDVSQDPTLLYSDRTKRLIESRRTSEQLTPAIPLELQTLSAWALRRIKLEMLGLGKYGHEDEEFKKMPITVIFNAFKMRAADPRFSLRYCLMEKAIEYEKIYGGNLSCQISPDNADGTVKPTGVPNTKRPKKGNSDAITLQDLMTRLDIHPMSLSEGDSILITLRPPYLSVEDHWPVEPRRARTQRIEVGSEEDETSE